ncbi:MAG: Hsp20/alpha crystallin family protein [Gemmatimonadetes bacterium]|nr:Hsp20/alpha crystallin family protein [Gemmatimonadota bacterium]
MRVKSAYFPVCGNSNELESTLEGLVNEFSSAFGGDSPVSGGGFPALDTREDETGFTVEVEVPGVKAEDIELTVLGRELTISGGYDRVEEENTKYHRRERRTGKFSRKLRFPVDVDSDNVEARHEHGVLTVRLRKVAAVMPRKIEVR